MYQFRQPVVIFSSGRKRKRRMEREEKGKGQGKGKDREGGGEGRWVHACVETRSCQAAVSMMFHLPFFE